MLAFCLLWQRFNPVIYGRWCNPEDTVIAAAGNYPGFNPVIYGRWCNSPFCKWLLLLHLRGGFARTHSILSDIETGAQLFVKFLSQIVTSIGFAFCPYLRVFSKTPISLSFKLNTDAIRVTSVARLRCLYSTDNHSRSRGEKTLWSGLTETP